MILYTPMPLELVLEGLEDNATPLEFQEIEYKGITMLVSPEKQMYRIQRVISTDPQDYINPDLQPGNLIKL
jgi:hypothetical protein